MDIDSDSDTDTMSATEIQEGLENMKLPAAYTNYNLLQEFIPVKLTPQGRRSPFQGIPWATVVKSIPSLQNWAQIEDDKKHDRQTLEEQAIFDKGCKTGLHQLPHHHVTQTGRDKRSIIGQFFAFIRLIEGKKTPLVMKDLYNTVKIKAWTAFISK